MGDMLLTCADMVQCYFIIIRDCKLRYLVVINIHKLEICFHIPVIGRTSGNTPCFIHKKIVIQLLPQRNSFFRCGSVFGHGRLIRYQCCLGELICHRHRFLFIGSA